MRTLIISTGLLLVLAGAALAAMDWGFSTGELCVSNQGMGVGNVVGGFKTNYNADPGGAEMKQWTPDGSSFASVTRQIVSTASHSGGQCLWLRPLGGGTFGSLNHLRTPTLSAPAGETGALTISNRPAVSGNFIFSFWVRTAATNGVHAKSAGPSSVSTSADEGAGSRIGSPFWLLDGGGGSGSGEFRMAFSEGFYLFNPYDYGYNIDPNPNPTTFSNTSDPDSRGALKRYRSYEGCSLASPALDYARWYKVEYRIDFADGMNNNILFTGVSYPDGQTNPSGSAPGIAQSNLLSAVCTLARLPNDRMTITCWDDTGAQVFLWGSTTTLTNDPSLVARTNTYTGLFTQESRGFGPAGANCQQFRWSSPGASSGLGFYLDDVLLSSGNGTYSYSTSFELLPPPKGTVILIL